VHTSEKKGSTVLSREIETQTRRRGREIRSSSRSRGVSGVGNIVQTPARGFDCCWSGIILGWKEKGIGRRREIEKTEGSVGQEGW